MNIILAFSAIWMYLLLSVSLLKLHKQPAYVCLKDVWDFDLVTLSLLKACVWMTAWGFSTEGFSSGPGFQWGVYEKRWRLKGRWRWQSWPKQNKKSFRSDLPRRGQEGGNNTPFLSFCSLSLPLSALFSHMHMTRSPSVHSQCADQSPGFDLPGSCWGHQGCRKNWG